VPSPIMPGCRTSAGLSEFAGTLGLSVMANVPVPGMALINPTRLILFRMIDGGRAEEMARTGAAAGLSAQLD
jgi:hypothetical protein